MGKESSFPFKTDQLKSLSLPSLSYLFCIKTNRMKILQRFRKFFDEGGLPHAGESCDEEVLFYQTQWDHLI